MDILDDMLLPGINSNEELEDISNNLFIPLFDVTTVEVRKEPGRDKGIDFRMEVKAKDKITGFRFLVQLKATNSLKPNEDGSISLSVNTSNINYLLNAGIPAYYVLYFKPKNIFLFQDLHQFVKGLSEGDNDWAKQASHAMRLTVQLDASAIRSMYDRAIEYGKFSRTLTERLTLSASLVSERVMIDPNLNVTSDAEIRKLIENYGLYLINESRWIEILNAHKLGSQQIAATAKYNLVLGIASYYSSELVSALSFFKVALKLKKELSVELLEHLLLFDATVRFALGLISKEDYREKISGLGKANHIRYYVLIDQIKENYFKVEDSELDIAYETLVEQMNTILQANDANENIMLLVRCEMVLFEGSKINLDFARDFAKIKLFELLVPENLKIRQQMARAIMERKHAWADKANRIRQEVTVLKNYFVFYHVLLNETRVDYEFEAYTDLAVDMINAKTDVRVSERSHNLEALLKNLDQTIEYFKNVSYVENVCVGLSIKFEILHYRGDMEAANKVLSELETIIETYDLKQLQPKFEALRNGGTTHEKMAKFKADQNAHNRRLQEEHNAMVRDMKNLDALDAQRMLMVDQPDTIGLYPIGHFQFSRTERNRVYDILQISERVRSTFDQMWDIDKIIPVANIYHNPITHEGHWDGQILNTSIEAWRNIYAVRKAFFDNGFPRIVLKFGKTDNF